MGAELLDMADDLTEILNRWVYDIEGILARALEDLRDHLESADPERAKMAKAEAHEILGWLHPLQQRITERTKKKRIEEIFSAKLPPQEMAVLFRKIDRSTGRPRGRPRTSRTNAIMAFSLHLQTRMSWREIALRVTGCEHAHPKKLACKTCAEKVREAVGRLDKFLRARGYRSNVARRIEFEKIASADDFERLWPLQPRQNE